MDESSLFPTLEKTISIIHESNGLAFLAHLYEYSATVAKSLEELMGHYLFDGMECYYTTFKPEQTAFLSSYCETHNLFKSGGSDFHGKNKVNHNLGVGSGSLEVQDHLIEDWKTKKCSRMNSKF